MIHTQKSSQDRHRQSGHGGFRSLTKEEQQEYNDNLAKQSLKTGMHFDNYIDMKKSFEEKYKELYKICDDMLYGISNEYDDQDRIDPFLERLRLFMIENEN